MADKEDVIGFIKDVQEDIKSRIENLEAVKGKVFSENVMTYLTIHSIFDVGSSALPRQFRAEILAELTGRLIQEMLVRTVESNADRQEIFDMANNISDSMAGHASRLAEMLKG